MNVWNAYRSLSAEQKHALSQKEIALHRPIDELLAFFKPLAAWDRMSDKARTPFGCGMGLGIVVAIVLFWVIGRPMGLILSGLFLLAAIAAGVAYFRMKSIDLSNNFRQFAVPVLTVFREDFDATVPLQIRLDLRQPTDKAKRQSESKPYKHGAYHKIIDRMFLDPWMEGEAQLVDGSRLRWSITDSIRQRTKTKRNARGKYKTKTKVSKRSEIDVELTLKTKSYTLGHVDEAEVKRGESKNSVRVTRRVKSASLDPVDPKVFIDLVAGIYSGAAPVQ